MQNDTLYDDEWRRTVILYSDNPVSLKQSRLGGEVDEITKADSGEAKALPWPEGNSFP